jgi:molybdopterin converting factor small subunit
VNRPYEILPTQGHEASCPYRDFFWFMRLRIHLFAYLAKFSPTGQEKFDLEMGPEKTVGQLLDELQVPLDFEKRVLVNGRHADSSARLAEGDDVFIFPPAAGG